VAIGPCLNIIYHQTKLSVIFLRVWLERSIEFY